MLPNEQVIVAGKNKRKTKVHFHYMVLAQFESICYLIPGASFILNLSYLMQLLSPQETPDIIFNLTNTLTLENMEGIVLGMILVNQEFISE